MTDESTSAPSTMDDLSDISDQQVKQVIVLIVLGICSASLSAIGSTAIVFKIVRGFRSMTAYDRMVLGMSICDILASINIATDRFLVPRSKPQYIWAFGNQATCQASAFFNFSFGWAIWYNALLSLYFLLMVLSQVRRKEYVRKFELWMHLSGLWFPITATMGLFLGWYSVNASGLHCEITDPDIFTIVYAIPALLSLLLITVDYILICAIVRKSLQSNNDSQMRLKKETTTLMILYVGSICVVLVPFFVRNYLTENGYTASWIYYPLRVLQEITLPLQGFLNAFIYFKPAYTRFRAANPNKPIRFVLHQALFNRTAPRSNYHHRNGQHVTHGSAYTPKITDITRTDTSSSDRSASNAVAEDDVGVGITGIDFETRLFFHSEDAAAENNVSPLEGIAEENDDSPDSNL